MGMQLLLEMPVKRFLTTPIISTLSISLTPIGKLRTLDFSTYNEMALHLSMNMISEF